MRGKMNVYLDNAAIARPDQDNLAYTADKLRHNWHNPNSVYENGADSRHLIEEAKLVISKEINCSPEEIIFCSCGSEANALAAVGYLRGNHRTSFVTSTIEHGSILENPYAEKKITVDQEGTFHLADIGRIHHSLVSLQTANSEIGTIQDIKGIAKLLHANDCIIHTDAVAAFGKIKIDVKDLDIDMMTATGQKIGGITGASFLYKKKSIKLEPIIYGHNTLRGGTPNTAAIASLGEAVAKLRYSPASSANRDYVYGYIMAHIPGCYLVGPSIESGNRLPHNLYLCFRGVEGQSLMILLDMDGIQVSTGSACSSRSPSPSAVLTSIGMKEPDIYSCIRMTFSGKETKEELDHVCKTMKQCVETLRALTSREEVTL